VRRCPIIEGSFIFLPPNTTHEILKLTLRSGEIFAVDLSGAQYGYHEPVIGWDEYKQTRVREIEKSYPAPKPLGILDVEDYSLAKSYAIFQKIRSQGPKPPQIGVHGDVLEMMNFWMLEWQFEGRFGIKGLWKLTEKKFLQKQGNLIDFVDWKLYDATKPYFTANGKRLGGIVNGSYGWKYVKD
jgi:hypothetical protein